MSLIHEDLLMAEDPNATYKALYILLTREEDSITKTLKTVVDENVFRNAIVNMRIMVPQGIGAIAELELNGSVQRGGWS